MIRFSEQGLQKGEHRCFELGLQDLPASIGRSESSTIRFDDQGVWERHAEVRLAEGEGFHVVANGEGDVLWNGERVRAARLSNGDLVQIGSVTLRFGFVETSQHRYRLREWGSWIAIGLLCLLQLGLVYYFLP